MIKSLFSIIALFILAHMSFGQQVEIIANFQPELNYENVHVYELDSDPLTSTYLIWVKSDVKEHYHAEHTEVVYVLEGEGELTLGDTKRIIRPGDYIFIPKGTRHSVLVKSESPMKVLSVQTPQFDGSDRVIVE